MASYQESRRVSYTHEEMFAIVLNISNYPNYLPLCESVSIIEQTPEHIITDMAVGIGIMKERLRTRVTWVENEKIDIEYISGPFEYLQSHWEFLSTGEHETEITFRINFEGKGFLLKQAIRIGLPQASSRVITAFEREAHRLYG